MPKNGGLDRSKGKGLGKKEGGGGGVDTPMHTMVDLSVAIMQETVSVAIIQLGVSTALMQVTVSAVNIWVTIFIVIAEMGVSVAIMQMVFSAVHYAHDCFHCNYGGDSFSYSYVEDNFK